MTLTVALFQNDPIWQNPELNKELIATHCRASCNDCDLIVLPEMFTAGFGNDPKQFAESADGPTKDWMISLAQELNLAICGSYAVLLDNKAVNRLLWAFPDGTTTYYDKRHLFRMANEHHRYHSGHDRVTVDYRGWRINLQVCYDLRFPVWCRNKNDFDLQIFVANWPSSRQLAWRTLLQARAIENLAYVIGVNRTGTDGKGLHYSGDSMIVNGQGDIVLDASMTAGIYKATIDLTTLQTFRDSFPAHLDADQFVLAENAE
jgi:omega-amidase